MAWYYIHCLLSMTGFYQWWNYLKEYLNQIIKVELSKLFKYFRLPNLDIYFYNFILFLAHSVLIVLFWEKIKISPKVLNNIWFVNGDAEFYILTFFSIFLSENFRKFEARSLAVDYACIKFFWVDEKSINKIQYCKSLSDQLLLN